MFSASADATRCARCERRLVADRGAAVSDVKVWHDARRKLPQPRHEVLCVPNSAGRAHPQAKPTDPQGTAPRLALSHCCCNAEATAPGRPSASRSHRTHGGLLGRRTGASGSGSVTLFWLGGALRVVTAGDEHGDRQLARIRSGALLDDRLPQARHAVRHPV